MAVVVHVLVFCFSILFVLCRWFYTFSEDWLLSDHKVRVDSRGTFGHWHSWNIFDTLNSVGLLEYTCCLHLHRGIDLWIVFALMYFKFDR